MKSHIIALAALAVMGLASAAYAGDAAKPKAMSDSDMDKVTAGDPGVQTLCVQGNNNCLYSVGAGPDYQGFAQRTEDNNGYYHSSKAQGAYFAHSDIRLKQDIVQVGQLKNGLRLYRYRYKWSDQVYVGVMAQEVALVRPDAVIRGADGYLLVDYSRLGLHLMTWEEWVASPFKTAENAKRTGSAPTAMSDSEMDKVTAGTAGMQQLWIGGLTSPTLKVEVGGSLKQREWWSNRTLPSNGYEHSANHQGAAFIYD